MQRSTQACLVAGCLFALASLAAATSFTEQPQFGARTTLSVSWGDADGDGDPDVAVANTNGNELYLNNGNGTFTGSLQFGTSAFAIVWGDCDNDGDQDCAVGRQGVNFLYVNNNDGTFTRQTQFGALATVGMSWADYDQDGDLDLAVANGILGTPAQSYIYINNGDGTWTASPQFGVNQTQALVWGDCDGDGDLDVAAANGGFGWVGQNYLYINNGDGTFTQRAEFGNADDTTSMDWGDADGDGDLDLVVGNWQSGPNRLYLNAGDGTFTEGQNLGWRDCNTIFWADLDSDGDLDVGAGNGDFVEADSNFVYVNQGGGTFVEEYQLGLGSTDGLASADYDEDGDLDVASGNEHHPAQNYLYVNAAGPAPWLELHLIGHFAELGAPYSNRDGIGAKVSVYAAGHLGDPAERLGFHEVHAHAGFAAQSWIDPYFAVPGHGTVDVRIVWPGSGGTHQVQDLASVAVGQRLTVHEMNANIGVAGEGRGTGSMILARPNPTRGPTSLTFAGLGHPATALQIFDVGGQKVRSLPVPRGAASAVWDGTNDRGVPLAPGVYYVRLGAAAQTAQTRVVLIP